MGCSSSKKAKDENVDGAPSNEMNDENPDVAQTKKTNDKTLEDDSKKKTDGRATEPTAASRKNRDEEEPMWDTRKERCSTNEDLTAVVMETLRVNFDLLSINDFKNYIESRYLCEADESEQEEVIHKVVGELFVKGCLAIKPI